MNELMMKTRLLLKAEAILFRLHLRRTVRQAAFYLVAVLLAVLAVGMLNIALYHFLAARLDNAGAALAVAVVDVALAAAAVVVAGRLQLGPEADAAQTLREMTMAELMADAERVKAELAEMHDDIKKIRTAVTGFLSLGGLNVASVFQWLTMLLRVFWRRKDP